VKIVLKPINFPLNNGLIGYFMLIVENGTPQTKIIVVP